MPHTEDEAGEASFFYFDFYNLPALHQTIRDGEFVEPDSPDHPSFLEQAERLKNGEQDWFVGALYYPHFSPATLLNGEMPTVKPRPSAMGSCKAISLTLNVL